MDVRARLGHAIWHRVGEPTLGELHKERVTEVWKRLNRLDGEKRRALLVMCVEILKDRESIASEALRISFVKILIALLPESLRSLQRIISDPIGEYDAEIRFTVFCFLNESLRLGISAEVERALCDAVGTYLHKVRKEGAQAPWMAGHLLGAHWPAAYAVATLAKAATGGRFAAGREAAINGLSYALDGERGLDDSARAALCKVSQTDRSPRLRRYAQSVLENDVPEDASQRASKPPGVR